MANEGSFGAQGNGDNTYHYLRRVAGVGYRPPELRGAGLAG